MNLFLYATTILLVCCGLTSPSRMLAQKHELPSYVPEHHVTGVIHVWGSPQMGELLKRYEDGFRKNQPGVQFVDELKSTITAVAGVYADRADIGLLGREVWPVELQAFRSIKGYDPLVVEVATGSFDVPKATFALMIFVPISNPIRSLSTDQLERIFAKTDATPIRTWGDLGLMGSWAQHPLHLYGFSTDNDKAQIFSRLIFKPDERWSLALHEFTNATTGADAGELIVQAVAADPYALGISNVHYATDRVKALPLSRAEHSTPVPPTRETVADRTYPLTRAVYIVADQDKSHPLNAATNEFLRYVLSRQGKDAVEQEGNYLPLTEAVAAAQRLKLNDSAR